MPRFNATRTRARNRAAVEQALAKQRDQYAEDYATMTTRHRQELARLRRSLDEASAINEKLSAALDSVITILNYVRIHRSGLKARCPNG